jgi:formylglycine-generating enzyme required for sulfatase activity
LSQVLWRNRTLQEFLTAYWLANHGTRELGDRLWKWIYRPTEPLSAEYYWVWRFLTEMPDKAIGEPKTWIRAIEPLYRPGNGLADQTKRSSEMIYRSWRRLDALAEQKVSAAVQVRDVFLGEFERIRTGKWDHNAEEGKRRAEEFIRSLLEIPAGRFRMGAPAEKQSILKNETPDEAYREPYVDAFRLSHSPTINPWYRLYDPGHGAEYKMYSVRSPSDETPVIYVTWYDAWAFCLWAHWDGQSCRLPQEHEWEYAAKAGTPWDWSYWWGDTFDATKCYAKWSKNGTSVPTKDHANPFGLRDILGNVLEWCVNGYQERYAAMPPEKCSERVLRGGNWEDSGYFLRSAHRVNVDPSYAYFGQGFRVARDLRRS